MLNSSLRSSKWFILVLLCLPPSFSLATPTVSTQGTCTVTGALENAVLGDWDRHLVYSRPIAPTVVNDEHRVSFMLAPNGDIDSARELTEPLIIASNIRPTIDTAGPLVVYHSFAYARGFAATADLIDSAGGTLATDALYIGSAQGGIQRANNFDPDSPLYLFKTDRGGTRANMCIVTPIISAPEDLSNPLLTSCDNYPQFLDRIDAIYPAGTNPSARVGAFMLGSTEVVIFSSSTDLIISAWLEGTTRVQLTIDSGADMQFLDSNQFGALYAKNGGVYFLNFINFIITEVIAPSLGSVLDGDLNDESTQFIVVSSDGTNETVLEGSVDLSIGTSSSRVVATGSNIQKVSVKDANIAIQTGVQFSDIQLPDIALLACS